MSLSFLSIMSLLFRDTPLGYLPLVTLNPSAERPMDLTLRRLQLRESAQHATAMAVNVAAAPRVAHGGDQRRGDDEGDDERDDEVARAEDGGGHDAADQRAHDTEEQR